VYSRCQQQLWFFVPLTANHDRLLQPSVSRHSLEPGATLRVGDVIHILGHTTDFSQRVESLEVNRKSVLEVGPNDDFGLKMVDHAREHDVVFKVRS
jgi:hypothetical protein